jgi:predicted PurR-regulated permease PerM
MTGDRAIHTMLGVCAAILVVAALYLARSILAPIAFAWLIGNAARFQAPHLQTAGWLEGVP